MIEPSQWKRSAWEVALLVALFFIYAGDAAPMVNEAHYLVKAKNSWNPDWCANDLFAASGKAHTTFYVLLGWPTQFVALETTAWIGRFVGWLMLAIGLQRLCLALVKTRYASLIVAVVWIAGVEYGNLAGEWVVGGIEAKVPAYGLVLVGLSELVVRRWNRVWVWFGGAAAFHVLSGGWAVVAGLIAWLICERPRVDARPLVTRWLFVGGGLSLFGLVPALALTMNATPEESMMATRIYSYFRLRHHLLPADFAWTWYARHGLVLLMTGWMWRFSDRDSPTKGIVAFGFGAVLIAACGMLVGLLPPMMPDLAAKLLRFYWFRLSDAIVPLVLAVLVASWIGSGLPVRRRVALVVLGIATGLVGYSSYDRARMVVPPSVSNRLLGWDADATPEVQIEVFRDWLAVCRWAELSTPPDEIFITPRHQQTFKWYAGRAEVANWKDVPQDAESLLAWRRRFFDVYPARLGTVRTSIRYTALRELRETYGVRFMIVDRRVTGPHLPLVRLYPLRSEDNTTYAVYELPR